MNAIATAPEWPAALTDYIRERASEYASHPAADALGLSADTIRGMDDDELAELALAVGAAELDRCARDVAERSAAVVIYGQRGIGKSTVLDYLAIWLRNRAPERRLVFLDWTGTRPVPSGFDLLTLSSLRDARLLALPPRAWLRWSADAKLPDAKDLEAVWDKLRDVVLLIDEGAVHAVAQSIRELVLIGRNRGVGIVVLAQRWTGTSPDVRAQAAWTISGRVKGSDDRGAMEKQSNAAGWEKLTGDLPRGLFAIADETAIAPVWLAVDVLSDAAADYLEPRE